METELIGIKPNDIEISFNTMKNTVAEMLIGSKSETYVELIGNTGN